MVSLKFNLRALLKNQVYHFPSTHYANPLRRRLLRLLLRSANALHAAVDDADAGPVRRGRHRPRQRLTERLLWCFELPRRRLSKRPS